MPDLQIPEPVGVPVASFIAPEIATEFERIDTMSQPAATALRSRSCTAQRRPDEIVVCRTDPDAYRLPLRDEALSAVGQPQASMSLGDGATASAGLKQDTIGGWPSQQIMATVRFGL